MVAGVGSAWHYLGRVRSSLDAHIAEAEAHVVRLKGDVALVEAARARRREVLERLGDFERLRASSAASVRLLETLSQSVPEGVWFLAVKQTGTVVQVDGRSLSLASVTDFVSKLSDSQRFRRPIEIVGTSLESVGDTTVVRFGIKADALPLATH
jgi:type IV pilus assembly protein PilN